ncbi:MAG: amino acid ABC transporter permease [Acidimicrobiia bacterium]|nr:amino acid ABC transporter permease [Acidimicrobiia bacterium]MDH4306371.1 amino acid ABC transporter permease [Acidimicrobiia bacterium]MDH5294902.1 amino acid ABC transporter permease [Acidimicrobiia bacterium]
MSQTQAPSDEPRSRGRSRPRLLLSESGARGALIAFASTVAFLAIVVWQVRTSEAWPAIRRQFFSPEDFVESWPAVLRGFGLNIRLFLLGEVVILVFSLLLAMIRALRGPAFFPLRATTVFFIDVIRGIPMILLIIVMGFGVPALQIPGVPNSSLFWAMTAIILSYSAYTAEVYRSGIESVHESQRMAARSIGLTQVQSLRHVIVPQAVRNVIPALLNGFVSLQKDVALVFVVGAREAVREAQIITSRTFNYTSYIAATVLFLLVSIPLARFTDWYSERDRRRKQAVSV